MDEIQLLMDRLTRLENQGCFMGKVHEEQIKQMCSSMDRLEKLATKMADTFEITMKAVDKKWMIGMGVVILLAFFAGVNVWELLKGVLSRMGMNIP